MTALKANKPQQVALTFLMSSPSSNVCLKGPISTSRISSFCKHTAQVRAVREPQTTQSSSQTSTQRGQRTASNTEQSENCKQHREVREQQTTLSRELQTTPQSSVGAHLFSSLSCQCGNRHGNRKKAVTRTVIKTHM